MNTKDIEEIVKAQRPKLLPTEAEMDAYEQRLITTLTQHHQAEVERVREENVVRLAGHLLQEKGGLINADLAYKEAKSILFAPTKTDNQ